MKQKEKPAAAGGGGASGALRIFSSFSRGKAGLRGEQLTTPRSHSDPVLLRVRRRAEEPAQAAVPQIR